MQSVDQKTDRLRSGGEKGFRYKRIIQNAALICISLLVFLLILELMLRTGWFDGVDNPKPIWIPLKYKQLDQQIDRANHEFAKNNPYGFTDTVRSISKPEGVYRIAVLGDSFIFGDGVPYEEVWSHKLEKRIYANYENVELMNWGRNGWQTTQELAFLVEHGVKYDIDLLVVGFVTNDPDMGDYRQKYVEFKNYNIYRYLSYLFPNAMDFTSSYIDAFLYEHFLTDYGYVNWEDQLYSSNNLMKYANVLRYLSSYCKENSIRLLFVFTPNSYSARFDKIYQKIIPIFQQTGIDYLNLYPAVVRDLKHYSTRQLWANPADGHPGTLVTDVYADEVFKYLQQNVLASTQ